MRASERPEVQRYGRHVNPRLISMLGALGYGRLFTRARGERVEDHRGHTYIDALAGFGAVAAGHHHERLRARLERALQEEPWGDDEGPRAAELRARLGALAGLEGVVLGSSGAEAVDNALRLALASTGRGTIVSCHGAYHGLNLGSLSVVGEDRVRAPFVPLLPRCKQISFGDLGALEAALARGDVAAFVVEPLQIEGGMRLPPPGYLAAAQALCTRAGALLILDEIQAGLGRCGDLFTWQREGVRPDILVLGKALGGSYCALSATLTSPAVIEAARRATPDLGPGAPVAGVNVASAVALEFLSLLEDGLVDASRARGDELLRGLQGRLAGHPLVRGVRGRGLLVAIELGATGRFRVPLPSSVPPPPLGHWVSLRLLEEGIVCQPTTHRLDVLRLSPPLTISSADTATLVDRVDRVMAGCRSTTAVLSAMALRLGKQAAARWAFG